MTILISDLQQVLFPDREKPIVQESLIQQYMPRAQKICAEKGWDHRHARMLARTLIHADMGISMMTNRGHDVPDRQSRPEDGSVMVLEDDGDSD